IGAPLRRYRKPVLYVLTGMTLVFGGWQIVKADKESKEADKKLANLQSSVDAQSAKLDEIRVMLRAQVTSTERPTGRPTGPLRAHAVTLSWEANETTGIVGYN